MPALNVNPIAVVVGVVVAMVVGFLWYSPMLFSNAWMKLVGKSRDQVGSPGPAYALTIVFAALSSYVLGAIIGWATPVKTPLVGVLLGLAVGAGFVATSFGTTYLFEGRPAKLYLINAGYQVVVLVLMGLAHGLIP